MVCSGNDLLAKWVFEVWLFHDFLYLLVLELNGLLRIAACLKKICSSAKTLFSDPYIWGKSHGGHLSMFFLLIPSSILSLPKKRRKLEIVLKYGLEENRFKFHFIRYLLVY